MEFIAIDESAAGFPSKIQQQIRKVDNMVKETKIEEAVKEYFALVNSVSIPNLKAILYNRLGIALVKHRRFDKAIACFEEALHIVRETGEKELQATFLANIGTLYEQEGRWDIAINNYTRSLEIFQGLGKENRVMQIQEAILNVGSAHVFAAGLQSDAESDLELPSSERLYRLGELYMDVDNFETAIMSFDRAEENAHSEGNVQLLAVILNSKAHAFSQMNRTDQARNYYEQAIKISEGISDSKNLAITWNNLGLLLKDGGDYQGAIDAFSQSINLKKKAGASASIANSLFNLGKLYLVLADYPKAQKYAREAYEIDRHHSPEHAQQDQELLTEIELQMHIR